MGISIRWSRVSKSEATFQMCFNDDTYNIGATDLIDSLTELAEAAVSVIALGKSNKVFFENEPGQHVLELFPLNDGRVAYSLYGVKEGME